MLQVNKLPGEARLLVHDPPLSSRCGGSGSPKGGASGHPEYTLLFWSQIPPLGSPVPKTQRPFLLDGARAKLKISSTCL